MEAMDIDRERERDALADYVIVEKVIGVREQDGTTEYLVKCICESSMCVLKSITNKFRETPYL